MTENLDLRQPVEEALERGAWAEANAALAALWRRQPTPATAGYVVSRYERLRAHLPLAPCRLAVLRSFTVEPVVPLLRAAAFAGGIDLTVQVGDFNAYAQEMLNGNSGLYGFEPDVVVLAVQTRDVAPDLWERFTGLSPDQAEAAARRCADGFRDWARAFRAHSRAHLIVHNLELPAVPGPGILDGQSEAGQAALIRGINRELCRLAGDHAGVYVLDYDGLVARQGRARWHDERKWLTMRMPLAADSLVHLAGEWLRFLHPLAGRVCKVLATDLDNTLWGGVIGEEGMAGIKVGPEHPGAAHQALQRAMLDLYHRGVILAVCSKNNPADALEALQSHPGMLLRPAHFAALRVNWNDKAQSLREIAAELNVGVDAVAFLDDNPVERERVRADLPEVTVIELPEDVAGYAQALRQSPVFERLTLSAEDRERGRHYSGQRQRAEFERGAASLEDFYRSLQQEAEIAPVTRETLARVAQLTQKTNQFNLTTRRYTEQQIAELAASPGWQVYSLRVKDRFGDNGIVGVAILCRAGEVCEVDTFLLSCRVIGRTVETAFLSHLVAEARADGGRRLEGWFLPTKKNAPAEGFYAAHGFRRSEQREAGSLWSLDLEEAHIACPEWIRVTCLEKAFVA